MLPRLPPRLTIALEVAFFVATLVLALIWNADPDGRWEPALALVFVATAGLEIYRRRAPAGPQDRFATPADRLRHRERLRQLLQEEIYNCRAKGLRQDVIVRDAARVDVYPDTDPNDTGISAWFRVGLIDTYERGICLGLRYGGLKACEGGYRFVDYVNDEAADRTVLLIGNVPYDSIVEVNLDGDKIYGYPHIFCHFDHAGEPYERLWFAERKQLTETHPYFELVAEYEDVKRNNPTDGELHFF